MKYIALIFFFGLSFLSASTQNLTATTPARLRVYALKPDGTQALMTSENLSIGYEQLKMTGELMLNTLMTDDENLLKLLDSAICDKITFSGIIPEGQFAFQSMVNSRFSVETEIFYGEQQGRILFDFDVSNRNTSLANTFDISCTGSISLGNDLGITRETGLDDKFSFQFFQNVQTKTY
jgi:hypothetical protein